MALYEDLRATDILNPVRRLIDNCDLWLDLETFKLTVKLDVLAKTPWVYLKESPDRSCVVWKFYFQYYKVIPKGCRECWKICCKAQSLRQLMKLLKFQERTLEEFGLGCKCGFEHDERWYARKNGLYSGYWYAHRKDGLEGALKKKEIVERALIKEFGNSMHVRLKRGCTEFELSFGDSSRWDELVEKYNWDNTEKTLDTLYQFPLKATTQPEVLYWKQKIVRRSSMKDWVDFAARNNDSTYLDFVDEPFSPDSRVYTKEDL